MLQWQKEKWGSFSVGELKKKTLQIWLKMMSINLILHELSFLFSDHNSECQSTPSNTTLPDHKWMDLLEKGIDMNLLFFNSKFSILNKVFDILNF